MKKEKAKTNAMRLIESKKLPYSSHYYGDSKAVSGTDVAAELGQDADKVFKTLVTVGKSGEHYVFMVPVSAELNLKKAAAAAGEKSVAMIKEKELLPLTGYVHGGCSPIGMKEQFKTFIHKSAEEFETVFFSAGKIGYQIEMSLGNLCEIVDVKAADIGDMKRQ